MFLEGCIVHLNRSDRECSPLCGAVVDLIDPLISEALY